MKLQFIYIILIEVSEMNKKNEVYASCPNSKRETLFFFISNQLISAKLFLFICINKKAVIFVVLNYFSSEESEPDPPLHFSCIINYLINKLQKKMPYLELSTRLTI